MLSGEKLIQMAGDSWESVPPSLFEDEDEDARLLKQKWLNLQMKKRCNLCLILSTF